MCYFSNVFRFPSETIDAIVHALKNPKFNRVDLIVGIGMSGTLPLIPVSLKSNIPCGVIRKPNSSCHSSACIEIPLTGSDYINQYVIIDDFISSGNTIDQIISIMTRQYPHSECVGIILYQSNDEMVEHRKINHNWNEKLRSIPVIGLEDDIYEMNKLKVRKFYDKNPN